MSALLALAALLLSTAPSAAVGRAPAPGQRLLVAAAASLKPAVEEARQAFEAAHPGVEVVLTFGASGALVAQLRQGAPFHLFLSADREYPALLGGEGQDARVFAVGRLVVWAPPGSTLDLDRRGLAALADPAVRRVALANPAVAPYGRAAEAALVASGVHAAVKEKLVLGTSVAQAAQFATAGAVDAAILPRSLVLAPELANGRSWEVPAALHPPLEPSGVVLRGAGGPEQAQARAFLAFLCGAEGRAILLRHGYGLP
jgi:molybdate transport system substrate-binding protein